jgi:hypothetical protein
LKLREITLFLQNVDSRKRPAMCESSRTGWVFSLNKPERERVLWHPAPGSLSSCGLERFHELQDKAFHDNSILGGAGAQRDFGLIGPLERFEQAAAAEPS